MEPASSSLSALAELLAIMTVSSLLFSVFVFDAVLFLLLVTNDICVVPYCSATNSWCTRCAAADAVMCYHYAGDSSNMQIGNDQPSTSSADTTTSSSVPTDATSAAAAEPQLAARFVVLCYPLLINGKVVAA